jgi:hypothetical protein
VRARIGGCRLTGAMGLRRGNKYGLEWNRGGGAGEGTGK